MPHQYTGSKQQFIDTIESLNLKGDWQDFKHGLKYKTENGGTILWYSNTKTVLAMGKKNIEPEIQKKIYSLELIVKFEYVPIKF